MSQKIKKILSFDVGIVHLAYCLMQVDYETNRFTILDWDIIDTADDRHRCPFIMRGNKVCNKVATCMLKVDDQNAHYSCKAHWNKRTPMIEDIEVQWEPYDNTEGITCSYNKCKRTEDLLCNTTNNIQGAYCKIHHVIVSRGRELVCAHKNCNNFVHKVVAVDVENVVPGMTTLESVRNAKLDRIGTDTVKTDTVKTDTVNTDTVNTDTVDADTVNTDTVKTDTDKVDVVNAKTKIIKTGWCDVHADIDYDAFRKVKTRKISQNANKIPLDFIGASMYKLLDEKPAFLMVDEVLIENQPSLINPTMKSVAMILYSYFLMNCFHRKAETKSTVTNLSYCSASNKLKVGGEDVADKLDKARTVAEITEQGKYVYDITKETGVKLCKALVADNPEYLAMINKHKKQDDMADAMLQAFVMNFSNVPSHYAKMLESVSKTGKDAVLPKRGKAVAAAKPKTAGKGRGRPKKAAPKAVPKTTPKAAPKTTIVPQKQSEPKKSDTNEIIGEVVTDNDGNEEKFPIVTGTNTKQVEYDPRYDFDPATIKLGK